MSDSGPPLFDDGGGLPEVDRTRRRTDPGRRRREDQDSEPAPRERTVWDNAGDENWQSPNYLVRRAIVIGVAVVVLAAAVFVGFRALGGGDDGGASDLGSDAWNRVVQVDDTIGTVVLTDDTGEETARFRFGISPISDSALVGSRLVGVDADAVAVVDLATDVEIDRNAITNVQIATTGTLFRPSGSLQTVAARDATSERLVLVHGPTGDILDTAELETVPGARYDVELSRADPTGRNVLVTDSGNFQSVLLSFDRETPSFFRGLALAVNDSVVVTAQNVGTNADVSVFDHEGEPGVSAQTTSVRAAIIGDDSVIVIGIDGEVLALALDTGDVTDLGRLTIGTIESGAVAIRGDRLVVVGATGTAIVDASGTVLAEFPDARPAAIATGTGTGTGSPVNTAPRTSECITLVRSQVGDITIVELDTGTVVAEALATPPILTTSTGCVTVTPTPSGYLGITADAVIPVTGTGTAVAISPDGGTVATEQSNRVELVPRVTDPDAEPNNDATDATDLGPAGRTIYFADL